MADKRKNFAIALMGLFLVGIPLGAGFLFLYQASVQPLMPRWVRVADLDEVPQDGNPIHKLVTVPSNDAWRKLPNRPVGVVFVRHDHESKRLLALRATIAHGLQVDYSPESQEYTDCCWGGHYDLHGNPLGATAGEAMHQVGVQLRRDGVYVCVVDVVSEGA